MQPVTFVSKVHSEGRVTIPKNLREQTAELEAGNWYRITIEERVREPKDDPNQEIEEGGIGDLIMEIEQEAE